MDETYSKKQSICIVSATPLSVYFFLKPHISALSRVYEVTVIFDPRNDTYIGEIDLAAKIVPINMSRKLSPLKDLISLFHLFQFFRKNHFDLIISVAPKAGLLSMISATLASPAKRIHIFQGEFWASKKGFLRFILKNADSLTAYLADQVLAVSESERAFLAKENVTPFNDIDVLGHGSICGVNMLKYQHNNEARSKVRQILGIPQDATVALFMGRIVADKGVFELVQAFVNNYTKCLNLYLLIVGPDEDGIKESPYFVSEKFQDRMRFIGFTKCPEQYMSAADFFCLPSYREGFPISILEASAAGIPTIGSDIYGIRDAIEDDVTGILVNPRDSLALSWAIFLFYQDAGLRMTLGDNAKKRASNLYQQEIVVQKYIDYFSFAIQRKKWSIFFRVLKRFIDISLSLVAFLILAIPMLLILIGIVISSKGPVIYWSNRVGKNNFLFKMAKFRSMQIETPTLATDLLMNPNEFITPIGRFLRKFSLDELPQLWNIFRGDMSFVGPRPALYNQDALIEMRSMVGVDSIRPGLTGWAQVNGRDEISNSDKVRFDIDYLQNASLILDFKILCLTCLKVIHGDGVAH
jgi:lipopolysaccharide/colanic/teichoic acid biosynthesis glycosyltransferase